MATGLDVAFHGGVSPRVVPRFRIALRFLRGRDGRIALTVLAIALGVALVCALDLVARSMQLAFEEIIDTMAGRAALEVGAGDGGLVPEDLAQQVASVPGVELAVPVVRATAFPTDGSGEALTVQGVDFLNEDQLRVYEARRSDGSTIDDPMRFLAHPRSIVLTRTFAARRGLDEGSQIELDTPRGRRTFSILQLLEPEGVARVYGGNLLVLDIFTAEEIFTQRGLVSRIDVVVKRDATIDAVAAAIRAVLPAGLRVTSPAQRKLDLQAVMRSFGVLLRGVGLVGLVIAFLIAANGVTSRFERRAWQLGVLATIGARPRAIWHELLKEALLIATVSVVLGVGLGIGLAHVLLPVVATTTALNFNLIAPRVRLVPGPASIATAVGLGIAVTLLAAWRPATRAVQLGVAACLRGRAREVVPPAGRAWTAASIACAAAAAALGLQWVVESASVGVAATVLIAIALAALSPPAIQLAARVAVPTLVRVAGASGRLAATGLRDHPRRVGLTTATIAVGIAAVAWLWILARSFEGSVVDALARSIRADLVVTSTNIGSGFLEAPLHADVMDAVRAVSGVEAVAGWRALEWPYAGDSIGLSAYDPEYFRNPRFGEWPLHGVHGADPWDAVIRGEGVIVSTSFVKSFGKGVGDQLELDTPTGPLALPIVGVTTDFVSPKGTVEMSRDVFATRWRDTSVTRTFVLKATATSLDDLRRRIAAELGARFQLRILSSRELLDYFVVQVRRAFSVIPLIAAVVYLVILVGLANSLATSVLERRRELAIAQAIGLRPAMVRRVVALESLLIGAVGVGLAAVGGLVLATMWVERTFQLLLGWALDVRVPGLELVLLAAITGLVCLAAARMPARRAATLEVAEALRCE